MLCVAVLNVMEGRIIVWYISVCRSTSGSFASRGNLEVYFGDKGIFRDIALLFESLFSAGITLLLRANKLFPFFPRILVKLVSEGLKVANFRN